CRPGQVPGCAQAFLRGLAGARSGSRIRKPEGGRKQAGDLAWPRLLDAYACIQCNRCQDVCPAPATGKALCPSALEINKRMELNSLASHQPGFEAGESS